MINCKSIILTVVGRENCKPCNIGEVYIAKNKYVFEGVTLDNASDDLRFEIDLRENNIVNKDGIKLLSVNISKKTLLKEFNIINERYGEDELVLRL